MTSTSVNPLTMKAVRLHSYNDSQAITYEDAPRPRLASDEVLIRVRAAGVNPVDVAISRGFARSLYDPTLPVILGWEAAGDIEEVGSDVREFAVGDAVYTTLKFPGGGAYAQYMTAKASQVALKPASLDYLMAGATPLTSLTAWQALFDHGDLQRGQRVLIHAAAGGVGTFAVQMAHRHGAYVFATASGRNRAYLQELGADEVIDYTTTSFEEVAHDIDLVLEPLGGEVQTRSWQTMRAGGILVSIWQQPSPEEAVSHNVRSKWFQVNPNTAQLTEIARRIDQGKIRVEVEKVFELEEVVAALQVSEAGHVRGKLVLHVS